MMSSIKPIVAGGFVSFGIASFAFCGELSPAGWPKAERERVEKLESQVVSPLEKRVIESGGGLVSATVSPIAVYAGIEALKHGGTAADAAATTALAQVATQLGSVVSYAGVFTMVYYDAKSHKVYSMDAGYNSYLGETDPKSIPVSDLGPLMIKSAPKPTEQGAKGRETLVPGFMAGVEAMHGRFGRLPFRDLFEPAIWYAERGIRVSPALSYYFAFRAKALARTPEGQQFMRQAGGSQPKAGGLFVQTELTKTLKAVADQGSRYMYTGQWGQDFVKTIQREGGKASELDLARYEPIWSEPYKTTVFGHTVYVNGPPHHGAYAAFVGLNLAEALKLDQKGPYWTDPEAFQAIARLSHFASSAPELRQKHRELFAGKGRRHLCDGANGKRFCDGSCAALGPDLRVAAGQGAQALECDRGHRQRGQHCGRHAHDQHGHLGRHGHRGRGSADSRFGGVSADCARQAEARRSRAASDY